MDTEQRRFMIASQFRRMWQRFCNLWREREKKGGGALFDFPQVQSMTQRQISFAEALKKDEDKKKSNWEKAKQINDDRSHWVHDVHIATFSSTYI